MPKDDRYKALIADAAPRTLYVYRPVVNGAEIIAHFKKQGIGKMLPADDLHVTIAFSTKPVDWAKAGEAYNQDDKGQITVKPGGVRLIDKFGDALVLVFASSELAWRWCEIKDRTEAEWKWPDYQPHITLSYDATKRIDLTKLEPYTGKIVFGPEVFQEVNEKYILGVVEDSKRFGEMLTVKRKAK